jgi:hypothetical protein
MVKMVKRIPQLDGKIVSKMRMSHPCKKDNLCRREEKPENKIEENLSLRRRRIETRNARIKSRPDLKDKSLDSV